ncbi:uncharacterized protein TNCV_2189211 [Trichonephila clavipes]|nr:uncharacterized protein TNCV_2189211 [Trichonephila clavipes]
MGVRPLTSFPLSPTSRKDLRLEGYFEYPHAAKTQNIYKRPYLLRDSNPGPMAQQSDSLTTIQDGRLSNGSRADSPCCSRCHRIFRADTRVSNKSTS